MRTFELMLCWIEPWLTYKATGMKSEICWRFAFERLIHNDQPHWTWMERRQNPGQCSTFGTECHSDTVDSNPSFVYIYIMETDKKFLRILGQVIAERRQHLSVSQEELAHRAQMNRTYIGDIERGARNIALTNLCKLSMALETTPSKLLAAVEKALSLRERTWIWWDYGRPLARLK